MKGEMLLPFMIGRKSCYLITGWNFGFCQYPDWSSSPSKFLTNHKMSKIWFRTVLKLPLSRGFSVPVHVVSPAPWGLQSSAVFPSSFPYLWEAREGLDGAVCFSATFFVFSTYFLVGRHPTPPCEMDDFTVQSLFHPILP